MGKMWLHKIRKCLPSQALWLWAVYALVLVMIMLGGATRLTRSGLSIVEWQPITGIIPPINQQQWDEAFKSYQQYPEYQQLNKNMSLNNFKFIYMMEYSHRLLGRLIGIALLLPMLVFWALNKLSPFIKRYSFYLLLLGGAQGFLGWYMVKSGLAKVPHVSHYRLTMHLIMALVIQGFILKMLYHEMVQKTHIAVNKRFLAILGFCMLSITIIYGGFVAGLKAGFIYNTFPLMGNQLIPSEIWFNQPWWHNFFKNPVMVQMLHRFFAITTTIIIAINWLNNRSCKLTKYWLLTTVVQTLLGITTLIYNVPVHLGTLHQGWAVITWSLGFWILQSKRN